MCLAAEFATVGFQKTVPVLLYLFIQNLICTVTTEPTTRSIHQPHAGQLEQAKKEDNYNRGTYVDVCTRGLERKARTSRESGRLLMFPSNASPHSSAIHPGRGSASWKSRAAQQHLPPWLEGASTLWLTVMVSPEVGLMGSSDCSSDLLETIR